VKFTLELYEGYNMWLSCAFVTRLQNSVKYILADHSIPFNM